MTVPYRNKLANYMNDAKGMYAPVGSIFSVLVDANSDNQVQSPEYSYPGYLYCDGRELNIRDYPQLYNSVRNTYGGSVQVTKTQSADPGGIRRLYWINDKAFFNLYRDPGVNSTVQLPYPYGTTFRITGDGNGLGSLPSSVFGINVFYSTKAPTEDVSAYVPSGGTEFAYEIVFPDGVDPSNLSPKSDINFVDATHPNIIFNRGFNLQDYPYNVGTFFLPDYRDRIITGIGPVNGSGSPTVENALVNNVGQTGGRWFISKDRLLQGGTFFSVGDVRTRGYSSIAADILTFMTGSVQYTVGPVDDHIFSRPIEHFHYVLSSEPDESFESEFSGISADQYAVIYARSRTNIIPFESEGEGGLALGHSHGLSATPLNDSKLATYGNTSGIGGQDPEIAPTDEYDVNDPFLTATAQYSGTALIPYGTGEGEVGGFSAPNVTNRGSNYVAFGTPGTSPFSFLQTNRSVSYEVDLTEYEKLFVYAIMGNDSNGGERVNNLGEGLFVKWPDGSEVQLLPSRADFSAATGGTFQAYDSAYSTWRQVEVDIPSQYRIAGVRFAIKQTVVSTSGVGGSGEEIEDQNNPAGNPNAYDASALQSIGFRKPLPDPQDLPQNQGIYPITGSPSVTITQITYDAGNNICIATTQTPHPYESGQFVDIVGANPDEYNGTFEVLEDNLTGVTFSYTPENPPGSSPSTGLPVVKLSSGTFEEVITTPSPKIYVINNQTVVGGKTQIFDIPGTGVTFQSEQLLSPGTIRMDPIPSSSGTVTRLTISLVAPGGGGASSDTDGRTGGYAYASFPFKGNNYTIYAYGGGGGQDGNSGGAGGEGGTFLIPAALINDPDFDYSAFDGIDGQSGGGPGSDSVTTSGGGQNGANGTGGDGSSTTFTTTSNDTPVTYTSSGSWTAPATAAGEISRTITVEAVGGGGGGGNGNANSGCALGDTRAPSSQSFPGDGKAIGGSGGAGSKITATLTRNPTTLTFVIGRGGEHGFNERGGYADGLGYEPSGRASGGSGAGNGGLGATGAWGNGATGGGGGGATGVYFNGGNAIIGAAGGGGGGGSGGGYNGAGHVDGCYAGFSGVGADVNLYSQTSALDFNDGNNGTIGGCTAGGGGGGGGGAGPAGSANGGVGGQAGVGHNGNGGGTGGQRGDSAYRSDYATASHSFGGNGGSPGADGGDGYVKISVSREILNYGALGGAGGQGASVNFTLTGTNNANVAVVVGLQGPGGNGGDGSTSGTNGFVDVRYGGSVGGGEVEGEITTPVGVFYEGTADGVPGGSPFAGNIWTSSSNDDMIPITPGLGTGTSSKFAIQSGTDIPSFSGKITKYLPFTGEGTREYVISPLNLSNVERLRFLMIRGNNTNGGATPEEDIILYWRPVGETSATLVDTVITADTTTPGWNNYDIILSEGDEIRRNNVELVLRQTRPSTQDDNSTNTQDNYGFAAMTLFYGEVVENVFTPSNGATIENVDEIVTDVGVIQAGMSSTDGQFEMSSSTPISTTALVVPESNIPLITRYHRVKYLIKAI